MDRTPYTCRECGDPGDGFNYYGGAAMVAAGLCFGCNHWTKLLRHAATSVRVNGHHYQMGVESAHPRDKGHAGARFVIRFHDGRTAITTNLWHQGEVPAHFAERLPDNAVFDHDCANELGRVFAYARAVQRWDRDSRQSGAVAS